MKIETLNCAGFMQAIHGMRNPMNSWEKSDSVNDVDIYGNEYQIVGANDRELSLKLQKAGAEHCKHLRMIMVWADITAPRYWWNEFDTYRIGVEKVSCSTMHKLMARPLTVDDFEHDAPTDKVLQALVDHMNGLMKYYQKQDDPVQKQLTWKKIIQMLPQSYIQKRTVMMSYAALRNIYRQREGHKLSEWEVFRDWVESLPESWMVTE